MASSYCFDNCSTIGDLNENSYRSALMNTEKMKKFTTTIVRVIRMKKTGAREAIRATETINSTMFLRMDIIKFVIVKNSSVS